MFTIAATALSVVVVYQWIGTKIVPICGLYPLGIVAIISSSANCVLEQSICNSQMLPILVTFDDDSSVTPLPAVNEAEVFVKLLLCDKIKSFLPFP